MHWRKRDLWKAAVVIVGALFLVFMTLVTVSVADAHGGGSAAGTVTVQATPTVDVTVTALNKEKLFQDVAQQQHTPGNWFWNNGAAVISSLVLALAGAFTLFRYLRDQRNEREKQREDRQAEREKRAEERFQSVVEGLGSKDVETRTGAAIMLRTFLQPGYEQFYSQAFDLAVAYLRLRHVDSDEPEPLDSLTQALAIVFKEAFPLARDLLKQDPMYLDAIGARLDSAYLARCDLKQVRLPEAYLRKVNFFGAKMSEANLRDTKLRYTNLTDADLTKTNLPRADLRGASLRGAHLTEANLDGASLTGANLRDTNIEAARSLQGTILRGVKGLTNEQLAACKVKGAIIDEIPSTTPSRSTTSPAPAGQSSAAQTPAAPPPAPQPSS